MLSSRSALVVLTLACVAGYPASKSASAQTLTDAMVAAYRTSPQFLADHARQNALDENVARAASGFRPQAAINGAIGRGNARLQYNYLNPPVHTDENLNPQSLSAQIVQPLYDGGRTIADLQRSKSQVRGGVAHAQSVEQLILGEAIQSYYDLYRDQAVLELSKGNVDALGKVREATQKLFSIHDVTKTDVGQADTRLARADASLAAAQGAVASSASAFMKATGIPPGALPAPPQPPLDLLPASLGEATSLALQNPLVKESEQAVRTAEKDVDYAASSMRPSLSLNFSSQYSTETNQGRFKQRYNTATANITIPLYGGGAEHARVREAKSIVSQRKYEADQSRRQASDQVQRSWQQLTSNRARITALKKQVEAAGVARTALEAERRAGSRTILDQLITEQDYLDSQIALVQAQHDEAVAVYSILSAVGRLTARAMQLPVDLYNPQEHYDAEAGRWFGWDIPDEEP